MRDEASDISKERKSMCVCVCVEDELSMYMMVPMAVIVGGVR